MRYDKEGRELPDQTPIEIPVGFKRPESLQEQIKRMVRGEMSRAAEEQGFETFEEADDFEVGDDEPLPISMHELTPMQEEFRIAKPDADDLDKPLKKEDTDLTVNGDRKQEVSNGGSSGTGGFGLGGDQSRSRDVGTVCDEAGGKG